ncbi:cupin domain-containing protein [uncultured Gordonia sp.]|uniref:cupin domain-containing protein n=1 Tax=uncultured Gordonia sp. TaxID=198437 RepID=UPI00258D1542|nr:cupin domain-containing protein [uncultured Gordonia sp.]
MTVAPVVLDATELTAYKISPDDTVVLVVLSGPTTSGSGTTVCFEIWEPRGAQPDNSHADSTETFVFLRGHGTAHSDEHTAEVSAGSVIVLPVGSVHHIVNTSDTEKLYSITVMENDGGFEDLILRGTPTELDADDLAVLASAGVTGAGAR